MIPLSVPNLAGNEWLYVKDCLDTNWVSSAGAYVGRFEAACADFCGAKYAVAMASGTAALHTALLLAGAAPGKRAFLPNITFVATANSVAYTGATPVLVDVDARTWQMDLDVLEGHLAEVAREGDILLPVHVLGNMCDMPRLMALAQQYGLQVVEDATESMGTTLNGQQAGTFGQMGCLSFNGNKIMTTGGGGMLLTQDAGVAARARHLSTTAKTDPVAYTHDEVGYNYRMVNLLAALGLAQIEQMPAFLAKKRAISLYYREALAGIGDVRFQETACAADVAIQPNEWLFTIATAHQPALMAHLGARGMQTRPLWAPMNRLPMFEACEYLSEYDCAATVHATCLSLPCSTGITDQELAAVVAGIKSYFHV